MQTAAIVLKHIQQEIELIKSINLLLSEERESLISRQFDVLEGISNEKMALSNQLEASAKERMALMNPASDNIDPKPVFDAFLKNCSNDEAEQINSHNKLLAEQLNLCRELNMINGQVIATNVYTREVLANTLSGNNPDALNIYTATGNVKSSGGNGHYQEV